MAEADEFARYPSLKGRVTFITGGSTGIGAELVAQFVRQGARVAFVDIDEEGAERLMAGLEKEGLERPRFLRCDVRDIPALQAAIADVGKEFGPIRALVNNVANDQRHPYETVTPEFWDNVQAINFRPHFFAIQAVAPMMKSVGGGSIINFGSLSWHANFSQMAGYMSAKAAIEGLTRAMARELGPDNIRVNCVVPGWIMTERQLSLWLTPEADADRMKAQCLKDRVYPADVARMVLWLAADDSRMCTNQNYVVDGGWI
jgi:NAD(P)-dependent dehydrogenase (short-subunit alcohol dehydrogenase family)